MVSRKGHLIDSSAKIMHNCGSSHIRDRNRKESAMTDTINAPPTAPAGQQEKQPRFYNLQVALGLLPDPSGKPSYIWVERWNARIIWCFIVIGVPLLGMSGFSPLTKWVIGALWFAIWSPFFVYFESRELIGQMLGRGSIRSDQLSEQQDSAQLPRYAIRYAVFLWAITYAIHVTVSVFPAFAKSTPLDFVIVVVKQVYYSFWDSWITYHVVEWFILIHTWFVTKRFNKQTYDVGNILSKATPMGERIERRVGPGN